MRLWWGMQRPLERGLQVCERGMVPLLSRHFEALERGVACVVEGGAEVCKTGMRDAVDGGLGVPVRVGASSAPRRWAARCPTHSPRHLEHLFVGLACGHPCHPTYLPTYLPYIPLVNPPPPCNPPPPQRGERHFDISCGNRWLYCPLRALLFFLYKCPLSELFSPVIQTQMHATGTQALVLGTALAARVACCWQLSLVPHPLDLSSCAFDTRVLGTRLWTMHSCCFEVLRLVVHPPPPPEPSLCDRPLPSWGGTVTTLGGRLQRGRKVRTYVPTCLPAHLPPYLPTHIPT